MNIKRSKHLWPQNCVCESDDTGMVKNHCEQMLKDILEIFQQQYKRQSDVKYKIFMSVEKMMDV